MKKASTRTKSSLHKKAWKLQSILTRRSNADWRGIVHCFTCYWHGDWKEAQAGHYKHGVLDFNPKNVHVQCDVCNRWSYGRPKLYRQRLVETYGEEVIDYLDEEAKQEKQRIDKLGYAYTPEELEAIIENLTQQIDALDHRET